MDGPLSVGHPTRSLVATWYAGGASPIRICNLYGDAYGNARERDETSAMVAEALASKASAEMKPAGSWKASVRPTELSNSQKKTAASSLSSSDICE